MNLPPSITERVKGLLTAAVTGGVFPGAVLLAATRGEIRCLAAAGSRCIEPVPEPLSVDTVFDLASLTKPLATGIAMMKLVDEGRLDLDEPLGRVLGLPAARGLDAATSRMVMSHCGGFPDWIPFHRRLSLVGPARRRALLRRLLWDLPPAYPPGTGSLYSDPGYMLLEWIVEKCSGFSLAEFSAAHYRSLGLKRTFLGHGATPAELVEADFAATERCPWRNRVVRGEVHDENAYALGGWSGHAGLFGTAEEVYSVARHLADHYRGDRNDWIRPETARRFLDRGASPCSGTWVLGWDTPSEGSSSSGRFFSRSSVGHLGFTGTSVWMDLARDVIVVLLTNRIHPTRSNEKIRAFRPLIHDAVMQAMGYAG